MSHAHAGISPATARRLTRQIAAAESRNRVSFQYRVRFRAKADGPFGQWDTLDSVFSCRKEAERAAAAACPAGHDISITADATNGP